jgi:hypothetical protein
VSEAKSGVSGIRRKGKRLCCLNQALLFAGNARHPHCLRPRHLRWRAYSGLRADIKQQNENCCRPEVACSSSDKLDMNLSD